MKDTIKILCVILYLKKRNLILDPKVICEEKKLPFLLVLLMEVWISKVTCSSLKKMTFNLVGVLTKGRTSTIPNNFFADLSSGLSFLAVAKVLFFGRIARRV